MQNTKLVNGRRVNMTAAEANEFRASQAALTAEEDAKRRILDVARKRRAAVRALEERLLEREAAAQAIGVAVGSDAPVAPEIAEYINARDTPETL